MRNADSRLKQRGRVYLVMSERNGYKAVHEVFADVEDAEECAAEFRKRWSYADNVFWVQAMNLL